MRGEAEWRMAMFLSSPSGLDGIISSCPSVKTLGYFQNARGGLGIQRDSYIGVNSCSFVVKGAPKIPSRALRARSRRARSAPEKSRTRKEPAPSRNPDARSRRENARPAVLQRRLCWRRINSQADTQTRGKFRAHR